MTSGLKILHVLRAPVGGLFRHVCDLAKVQSKMGHQVGLVCDIAGGQRADDILTDLRADCALGIHRIAMPRLPGPGDFAPIKALRQLGTETRPDIMHGHGAKGGLYGRLAGRHCSARTIYTPHGGALHYAWNTPQGALFLTAEKLLLTRTSGLAFVCQFEKDAFQAKIGIREIASAVVHNGVWPEEFQPARVQADASDLLFIGELRTLKGVDVLIEAIANLSQTMPVSATIVGDGPDRAAFENLAAERGLAANCRFTGALSASQAFELGRIIVIPSRAESFPYIVLEAIAAEKPIVASRVGGIPEVLPTHPLVPPGDPVALAAALEHALSNPDDLAKTAKNTAQSALKTLDVHSMASGIVDFYGKVLKL